MIGWKHALLQEQYVNQILSGMEEHGWDVDEPLLHATADKCRKRIEELDAELMPSIPPRILPIGKPVGKPFKKNGDYEKRVVDYWGEDVRQVSGPFTRVSFEPVNLGSDKQLKEYLFSIGWVPDEWNYNKKTRERTGPKLTESSLDSLDGVNAAALKERVQAAHRLGVLEGWIKNLRPDGRLSMVITGMTPTYRCTHAGIVNVPGGEAYMGHEMRAIFKAKPGYKMVGIDSKSNQLRMLCHYMQDEGYTDAVINGKKEDGTGIHQVNQRIIGVPTVRQAKNFIYGLLFGAQDQKLGSIINGSAAEGAMLRSKFMKGLPAYARMMRMVEGFWKEHKFLVGLDGRVLRPRAPHMLLVYLLQGAEAVYMKVALALTQKRAEKAGIDFQLVGFVHDELQYMVRDDHVKEFSAIVLKAFVDAGTYLKLRVPMEGDLAVGDNWAETH